MKPKAYVEMHIVFNNDYDVNLITKTLKVEPYKCQCKNHLRRSPITNEPLEGFWTLRSETIFTWDLKKAIDNLLSKITDMVYKIKEICCKNSGVVVFDIVTSFNENAVPAIYFERDFLDIVHKLNATIQIDMYVD